MSSKDLNLPEEEEEPYADNIEAPLELLPDHLGGDPPKDDESTSTSSSSSRSSTADVEIIAATMSSKYLDLPEEEEEEEEPYADDIEAPLESLPDHSGGDPCTGSSNSNEDVESTAATMSSKHLDLPEEEESYADGIEAPLESLPDFSGGDLSKDDESTSAGSSNSNGDVENTAATMSSKHLYLPEKEEPHADDIEAPPESLLNRSGGDPLKDDESTCAGSSNSSNGDTHQVDQVVQKADQQGRVANYRFCHFLALLMGAAALIAVGIGIGVALPVEESGDASMVVSSPVADDVQDPSHTHVNKEDNKTQGSDATIASPTNLPTSGNSEVMDIIFKHARHQGLEFEDTDSYQSKAARWVEAAIMSSLDVQQSKAACSSVLAFEDRIVQLYSLACLYYATNGVRNDYTDELFGSNSTVPNWIDENGWLVDEDECTWYRIECNSGGKVNKINLFQNRLTGSLPSEVTLLDALEVLDLYQNVIHNKGEEGNLWLGEMANLKKLFYGKTYFEFDGIPPAIGELLLLEEYDCSYTKYQGPLQGETFSQLSNLEYIHIGGNRYNSGLPTELTSLPNLEFMYAQEADLTGDLSFLLDMPAIIEVWIDRNPGIQGSIPSEIGLVSSLQSLSITNCGLTGTLPSELANLRLTNLFCFGNEITGSVITDDNKEWSC
jgi:hypothetical protein